MRLFRRIKTRPRFVTSPELGMTLLETLVALAVLGAIAVTFLAGLAAASKATFIDDEQATAESLARSQMEWVRDTEYLYGTTEYLARPIPNNADYDNYSAVITCQPLHFPADNGIQKITVTIEHFDKEILTLEGYKVER